MLFILVLTFMGVNLSAQGVDDVTLVVSGDGPTKEQATHVALRSAVEQAYGVFVSANTEILNDELVKDEIATVTSGNVKSFKELNSNILPNGNHMVVLQAVVSTKQLAAYAQSKGASCEFAGATFKANLMLIELNRLNTEKAFENMLTQLKAFAPYLYDRKLSIGTPDVYGNIKFYIDYYMNDAVWACRDIVMSTCSALNISAEELQNLKKMNAKVYEHSIKYDKITFSLGSWLKSDYPETISYNFYSPFPNIVKIFEFSNRLYITDNLNDFYSIIPLRDGTYGYYSFFDYPSFCSFQNGESENTIKKDIFKKWGLDYNVNGEVYLKENYNSMGSDFFVCNMFTSIIPPKKENISLPTCKTRFSYSIRVRIDPERLGKISNFELKQIPDNMNFVDLIDDNLKNLGLKKPEYVALKRSGDYVNLPKSTDNKPIILISDDIFYNDNLLYLYEMVGKYKDKVHIFFASDEKLFIAWACYKYGDYKTYRAKNPYNPYVSDDKSNKGVILFLRNGKVVDDLWLELEQSMWGNGDSQKNRTAFTNFMQKLLP